MKNQSFLFGLVITLLFACSNPEQTVDSNVNVATASFVANPQPVKEQTVTSLAIGAEAPDFKLAATDGKFYSLDDFKNSKALAIIFTCNHCPTAQAYEDRLIKVVDDYKDKGAGFVAISPNSPLGLLYEELGYSDLNDDYEEMKIRVKDKGYNFPYLYDGDDQAVSLKYGPVATPHIFLFDENRKLAYRGRFDKVEKPGTTNAEDFREALDAVLSDRPVPTPTTKTFGCSTKWGWKLKMKEKANKEWVAKSVDLSKINKEQMQVLLKNENSGKLRLINVWATWCGPCIIEYPEFIALQRMFGGRDFEFVSLSADDPKQESKALKFLQEKNSAVQNYIFDNADKYALIESVDPEWNGALPYTLLIEPNGNVVWKYQGEVDFYALKKKIVEHKMIGRYF